MLSLSSCPFRSGREFTCTVDPENLAKESDENNNTLVEVLLTGR
jgi:subtilase family serine protease